MSTDEGNTQRVLGRLEGRFDGLEARFANLDAVMTRQLNGIASKVAEISSNMETSRVLSAERETTREVKDAARTGLLKGGWTVIAFIGAIIVAGVDLISKMIEIFNHK